MKNKLTDLNNHLFAQMERLSDEALKPEQLETELARSKAIVSVSSAIVANARLVLEAQIAISEHCIKGDSMLSIENRT